MDFDPNALQGRLPARLLYRPDETAEMLGLSRTKVYELLASGELASIIVGGCRRIPAEALSDFIEQQSA